MKPKLDVSAFCRAWCSLLWTVYWGIHNSRAECSMQCHHLCFCNKCESVHKLPWCSLSARSSCGSGKCSLSYKTLASSDQSWFECWCLGKSCTCADSFSFMKWKWPSKVQSQTYFQPFLEGVLQVWKVFDNLWLDFFDYVFFQRFGFVLKLGNVHSIIRCFVVTFFRIVQSCVDPGAGTLFNAWQLVSIN